MSVCRRCGIDFAGQGWCADCKDVEGVQRRRRGERLSPDERKRVYADIREYAAMGISQTEIAATYGLSRRAVAHALGYRRVTA